MPARDVTFNCRISVQEHKLIREFAKREDRSMVRAVVSAVKQVAKEKYGMEVPYDEE